MDEIKRYIRFVLPGLSFVIIFAVTTWSSNPTLFLKSYYYIKQLGELGALGGLLLISGALGYIFAQIHFAIYWFNPISKIVRNEPQRLIEHLRNRGVCQIVNTCDKEIGPPFNARDSWAIFNRYFLQEVTVDDQKIEITKWLDKLTDHTHALGAASIGLVIGCLLWIIITAYCILQPSNHCNVWGICVSFAVWTIVAYSFLRNFYLTARSLCSSGYATIERYISHTYERQNRGVAAGNKSPVRLMHFQ